MQQQLADSLIEALNALTESTTEVVNLVIVLSVDPGGIEGMNKPELDELLAHTKVLAKDWNLVAQTVKTVKSMVAIQSSAAAKIREERRLEQLGEIDGFTQLG